MLQHLDHRDLDAGADGRRELAPTVAQGALWRVSGARECRVSRALDTLSE